MRFSDFLLVSDPADLDFIVGYSGEQNIRIDVSNFFAGEISGSGNAGYIPVFTSEDSIGNSQIFQDGSNIVIGGVNAMGYRLAVGGSLYALGGTTIESVISGSDTFRTIGEEGDSFIIPNDEDESIWTSRRIIHAPAVLTTESATLGQLNTAISDLEGDIELLLDLKVDKTSVGAANGVASLDSGGKVPLSQIPDSIIGQVVYMGTWNALTNTPTLNPLVPEEKGHYYVVSVAGTFGGVDYQVGDWIISNGIEWQKVDNTDAVTSVFGRIGAILALEADYQSFYPRLSQAYDNPTWINTLAFSKITGVPPFLLENQTITLSGDVTGSGKTSISTSISDNAVTDSKLRNSVGTSVIGRASSTTGDPADIQASTDGHVLQRSGGSLLFGLISSDSIGSIDWSKIINTPTTLSGYGITNAYTKTEADNKFVPYTGANANVNIGSNNITANAFVKVGGTSAQFLKADGSVDVSQYVPTTRSVNAGTGLTGGGNLSSDVTISFDTTWGDTRYAYRTRQLTINGTTYDLSADRTWNVGTVNTLTTIGTSGPATLVGDTLNIPNYTTDLSGYVTLATDQTITGLKTIVRSGDVLNFKIGTDTLYGLKLFYSQNELAPSGEATWSFVNTFNRDGSGYEVTPLSFFRGVLVTGERLVTASINTNLLDYYANNPTGRYPVYAYNTGIQQFSNAIVVGETNGIVNAISGAISDLPSGVVANFKGRVIGSNAVNSNEFVTLGQIPTLTGYVPYTGATQSVNLGEYGLTTGFLGFDLTPTGTPTTVGTMYWDPAYRTASLITGTGATTLQVGQEEVVLVHNNTGSALTDGQVVYVTGSTGNLPSVSLADASLESTSAATLGVVTETIANGADGFVTLSGIVNGLNTLAYNEGDLLWLSETAGQFTNIKPVSPAHLVLIGYVIKRAGGNGSIFVKIQNTQELAESSDVLISSPEVDGQGLFLQTVSGVQLWRNRSIADVLGYTPANAATTLTINGTTFDLSSNRTWSVGTVTSVAALTLGTSGTDLSSTVANGTTTPVITLNVPTASATNRGALSAADWSMFNAKQNALTLTTTGTSGAATLVGSTLNIPQYQAAGTYVTGVTATSPLFSSGGSTPNITIQQATSTQDGYLSSSDWSTFNSKIGVTGVGGTTNTIAKFTGSTTIGNSLLTDNGSTLSYVNDVQFQNGKWFTVNNTSGNSTNMYIRPDNNNSYVWRHIYGGSGTGHGTGVGGYGIYAEHLGGDYSAIFNTAGFVTFPYSARSPIFYDSDNTAQYIDPSSASNIRNLYIGDTGSSWSDPGGWGTQLHVSNGPHSIIRVYARNEGIETGVFSHIGGQSKAGSLSNHNFSIVRNFLDRMTFYSSYTYANGYLEAQNDMRSPIFYDSNNTGYYVDPSSGSRMNGITYDNLYFSGDTTYGFLGRNVYADTVNGRGSDPLELNYYDGGEVHIGAGYSKTLRAGALYTNGAVYGNIYYDSANTSYYLDPDATGTSLRIAGNVISNGSFASDGWGSSSANEAVRVFAPKGASASWDGNPVGAIKIRLPQRANNTMWSMKVRIYSYATNQTAEYTMGNYSYSQGGWNSSAHFIGASSAIPRNVRFGNEGGYDCVWIGETNTIWDYPVVSVMDFQGGFRGGNSNNWASGWDISYVTSFGTVAEVIYPTLRVGALISSNIINSPSGYISSPNPWSTGDSAYFPNGISTAGGTNWVYGLTYIGNAPGNGAGHEFYTSGSSYSTGNMEAGSSMRAPIFYDRDNTGYYLDPASTSNLYYIQMPHLGNGSANIRVNNGGQENWRAIWIDGGSGAMGIGKSDGGRSVFGRTSMSMHIGSGEAFRVHSDGWDTVFEVTGAAGNGWFKGDVRSPIYYDSNDTGYYIDPNSTSNTALRMRGGALFGPNVTWGQYLYVGTNGRTDSATASVCTTDGNLHLDPKSGNATYINYYSNGTIYLNGTTYYISSNGAYYNGTTENSNSVGGFSAGTFYRDLGFGSGYPSWNLNTVDSNRSGFTYGNGGPYTGPFIHIGASGYGLQFNAPYGGDGYGLAFRTRNGDNATWNNWKYPAVYGVLNSGGSLNATIYYDQDNTGYYLDPASTTYLNNLILSGNNYFRPNNWVQLDGNFGIFSTVYNNAHFLPNASSSYGNWRIIGNRNGYDGIYSDHSGVNGLMYDGGGNGGAYRENNGRWYFYYHLGNDCMGIGTSSTSSTYSLYLNKGVYAQSRIDATIFYDTNNTGYYLDPNSNSNLAALQVQTGVATNSFYATGAGGQITITAAIGSFGGYLRTSGHMVLDQTNTGYGVYVLDGNSVGVVKNAGAQSWSAFSDRTLKNIHSVIEDNLSKIQSITPIYYSFNNFADDKNRIGLIAQEVQEQFPELVEVEPRTQKLTLDYTGLIPVLLGAIKELKTEIETLKTKL